MTNKPMLSVELLPCPFCGSPASLEDHRLVWCVRCTKCSACVLGDRAPEPHGDGVSSDEVQDAQAAAMSERTDWAAYEKSAVDTWNLRSELGIKHQAEPVAGHCTHPPGCKSCSWCGFKEEDLAPAIKLHLNVSNVKVTVNSDGSYTIDPTDQPRLQGEPVELSTEELRFLDAVALNPGSKLNGGIACGEEGNSLWPRLEALGLIECLGSYKWQLTFSAFEMGVKAFLGMRPAPVADHTQCEECKGWGYHENHHEGGGTECGECGGSGNATVAVMPDVDELAQIIRKVDGSHTLGAGSLAEAIIEEVARLNGVKP